MREFLCQKCNRTYKNANARCPTCAPTPTTKPPSVNVQHGQQVRMPPTTKPPSVNVQQKQVTQKPQQNVNLTAKSSPSVMAQGKQLSKQQNVKPQDDLLYCEKCWMKFERGVWGKGFCPTCGAAGRKLSEVRLPDWGTMPKEIWQVIFNHLDDTALGLLQLACKRFKPLAIAALENLVPAMWAYGSGTAGGGGLWGQLQPHVGAARRSIVMAVDQFPCPSEKYWEGSILQYILAKNVHLDLSLGTPDEGTLQILNKARKKSARAIDAFSRMHNKIWVIDGEGVILGSPNVSYSGLICGNLESCIVVKSRRLGHLIGNYLKLLKKSEPWTDPQWHAVNNELVQYNKSSKVKVALAPITPIAPFVIEHLKDATKIIIRQFLITREAEDLLAALCGMAVKGVEIEVFIDEGAYAKFDFVQDAVKQLVKSGVSVYTQTPVLVVDTNQERIQHDKLILAELRSGVCRTLIGSAGFTREVHANQNAENFLCTDAKSIFRALLAHHQGTLSPKIAVTKKFE